MTDPVRTARFGLTILPPDAETTEIDRFSVADRIQIDALLYHAASTHRHDGAPVGSEAPPGTGLVDVTEFPGEGQIPAGKTLHYRWTTVTAEGVESLPSDIVSITSPSGLDVPAAATAAKLLTGGSMYFGQWVYQVTAWRGSFAADTPGSQAVVANLYATDGDEQRVVLTLPALPSGADGFNIYRQKPSSTLMQYLATVNYPDVEDPFVDSGSESPLPERVLTGTDYSALGHKVLLEAAYPIPPGAAIRVYRTGLYESTWSHSLLGELTTAFPALSDLGQNTGTQSPPTQPHAFTNPPPIDLATESVGGLAVERVSGAMPYGQVQAFGFAHEFTVPGPVAAGQLGAEWVVPFQHARPLSVSTSVALGSAPDDGPLTVDVELYLSGTGWVPLAAGVELDTGDTLSVALVDLAALVLALGTADIGRYRLRAMVTATGADAVTPEDVSVQVTFAAADPASAFSWG